jgi:coproporphyrinogen III oxidase
MSLPAQASWEYDVIPQKNSPEALTSELLVKGVNWLELS